MRKNTLNKLILNMNEQHCDKIFKKIQSKAKSDKIDDDSIREATKKYSEMDLQEKREYIVKVMNKAKELSPQKYNNVSKKISDKIDEVDNLKEEYLNEDSVLGIMADIVSYVIVYIGLLIIGVPNLVAFAIGCLASAGAHILVLKKQNELRDR